MSILHFCSYSAEDAEKMCKINFHLILNKIEKINTLIENQTDF